MKIIIFLKNSSRWPSDRAFFFGILARAKSQNKLFIRKIATRNKMLQRHTRHTLQAENKIH
jgi:hypothetical protein